MDPKPSFCLDVFTGHGEHYREELLAFLHETGEPFAITTVQRGRMGEVKSLRILTPKAKELYQHIHDGTRTGDDNDYEVHDCEIDAQRSMRYMPDYNNPLGDEAFDLKTWKPLEGAQPFDHKQGRVPRADEHAASGSGGFADSEFD
jgi:hypothetical protein